MAARYWSRVYLINSVEKFCIAKIEMYSYKNVHNSIENISAFEKFSVWLSKSYCEPGASLNSFVLEEVTWLVTWFSCLFCWVWALLGSYFRGLPLDKCRLFINSASSTIQKDPKSSSYLTKHLCSDKFVRIAFYFGVVFLKSAEKW